MRGGEGRWREAGHSVFGLLLRPPGECLTKSGEVQVWPKAGYGSLRFTCGNFSTGKHFHFVSLAVLTVQETLLTSSALRLLGKKHFRVRGAILESGHCVSEV